MFLPSLALASETTHLEPLQKFLSSLNESSEPVEPFPPTPLDALYTEGMDADQIWEQLELRNVKLVELLEDVGAIHSARVGDEDEGSLTLEEKIERGIVSDPEGEEDSEELGFEGIDDMEDSGDSESGSEEEGENGEEDEEMFDEEEEEEGMFDQEDEEDEEEEEDEDDDTHKRIQDLDEPGYARASRKK